MTSTPAGSPDPSPPGDFLLATCQSGAEDALVARLGAALPGATRGAWRRGAVTLRLPPGTDPSADDLERLRARVVFARCLFRCFGQARWHDDAGRAASLATLLPVARWDVVHCFPRDVRGLAASDVAAGTPVAAARLRLEEALPGTRHGTAAPGELVLDCLVDEADRWWLGWHRAASPASCQPGGFHPRPQPGDVVSRAWLKLDEAIATMGVDFRPGETACELGAAPGGACQRMLADGVTVVAIDPALVDPVVAAAPGFVQWRKRARDVPLRDLRGFDWVVADMNIDPTSALAAVERVVTAPGSRARGIVLTLKLPDWSRAADLDAWLDRIHGWGFDARVRQLSTGGREVCVTGRRRLQGGRPGRGAATRGVSGAPRRRRARPRGDR